MISDNDRLGLTALVLVVAAVVCVIVGAALANTAWKADSVRRGFAEYSNTTGEWQWKDSRSKEEKP